VLVLLLASGVGAQEPAAQDPRLEWVGSVSELHRTLAAPLRASRSRDARGLQLVAQLTAPGAEAIAPLFDILVQERVPRAQPADAGQILSEPQRQLLLGALAQLPPARVRQELERRLKAPEAASETAIRMAGLRVLSVIGTRADLPALAALAPRAGAELEQDAADALRASYAAILRREPSELANGFELLRTSDHPAAKQLLFALGDLRDKRALPVLDACARSVPELAQQAVALVPLVGASGQSELDQSLAEYLARRLDPGRIEWSRAALRAIGVLDDGSQVPTLLEQLDSQQAGLREAAVGALQQISGLQLSASKEAWLEWYARELKWQTQGREEAQAALAADKDEPVARALAAYAVHKLFRDQLAEDVLPVLGHESPALRTLACETLARIGSQRALLPLIELFSSDDHALAEAAWRSACALSGKVLPRTPSVARARLANS